jgi:hypothetical protein
MFGVVVEKSKKNRHLTENYLITVFLTVCFINLSIISSFLFPTITFIVAAQLAPTADVNPIKDEEN